LIDADASCTVCSYSSNGRVVQVGQPVEGINGRFWPWVGFGRDSCDRFSIRHLANCLC